MARSRFDTADLDEIDPFEVDHQRFHLFKHEGMDVQMVYEVWMAAAGIRLKA
jgi:hypothetical protein